MTIESRRFYNIDLMNGGFLLRRFKTNPNSNTQLGSFIYVSASPYETIVEAIEAGDEWRYSLKEENTDETKTSRL